MTDVISNPVTFTKAPASTVSVPVAKDKATVETLTITPVPPVAVAVPAEKLDANPVG